MLKTLQGITREAAPRIVMLHWLSGSYRSWTELSACLAERGFDGIALDLPGFGNAQNVAGFDVAAMRDAVISGLHSLHPELPSGPWLLAGHSMGGKVAAAVARTAVDGASGLENLRGMVLFSPSPPAPEPMEESKRREMIDSLGETTGDKDEDRKRAGHFVDENTGVLGLPTEIRERAVADVMRMNRTAFRMWLERGSKEDWDAQTGILPLDALVFCGTEEQALGESAQREFTLPHFAKAELVPLEGAGHLNPMERPREATEYVCEFALRLGFHLPGNSQPLDASFESLMRSGHTSPQTRAVMENRLAAGQGWEYVPRVLGQDEFRTLRALAERIVPKAGFDVAAIVEANLAKCTSDGWRFANLPQDSDAWRLGLKSLDAAADHKWEVRFFALDDARKDELLEDALLGKLSEGNLGKLHLGARSDVYSADEMKQWFEDVRSEFAKCYMAHPGTMNKVGFTGFADESGFTQIRLGEREEFEL